MAHRRDNRGSAARTDRDIVQHEDTMLLLQAVAAGRISRDRPGAGAAFVLHGDVVPLRALAREDLIYAPIAGPPTLAPRGARLLAAWRGEEPWPLRE
jgi:hypothetical protein